jgi:hypothetical protein
MSTGPYGQLTRATDGTWALSAGDAAIPIGIGDTIEIGTYGGRKILATLAADPTGLWPPHWLVSAGFPRPYSGAYALLQRPQTEE